MNRDEALTETAMEVSPQQWGEDSTIHYREFEYGWNEYQQRRTELINEPDDADAPEWARWKAQDADGCWYWHVGKPVASGLAWIRGEKPYKLDFAEYGKTPVGHDWRTTLREVKPEPNREMCGDGYPCDDTPCSECPNQPDNFEAEFDAKMLDQRLKEAMDATNPKHYRKGDVECIDALKAATVGKTGIEAVCVANAIKYLWRYEEKNGVEDVEKALWYLNRLHDELHD